MSIRTGVVGSESVTRRSFLGSCLRAGISFGIASGLPYMSPIEVFAGFEAPQEATGLQLPHTVIKEKGKKIRPVILLWLDGGASRYEMHDPKFHLPGHANYAPEEIRGDFKPIQTSVPGVFVSELMPLHAQRMHKLALINTITHKNTNHEDATNICFTGNHEFLGSRTPLYRSPSAEMSEQHLVGKIPNVVFQTHKTFQVASPIEPNSGLFIRTNSDDSYTSPAGGDFEIQLHGRKLGIFRTLEQLGKQIEGRQANQYRRFFDTANLLLDKGLHVAFDLSQESDETRERYGRTAMGNAMLASRRLVELLLRLADEFQFDERFVITVNCDYWDDHDDISMYMNKRVPIFDQASTALIDDVEDIAYVVEFGEFGRTPKIIKKNKNNNNGRDHWPDSNFMVVAGPGIKGGTVLGSTDNQGKVNSGVPLHASLAADSILGLGGWVRVWTDSGKQFHRWQDEAYFNQIFG